MEQETVEIIPPLTVLSEDERLFQDSVREFADARVRPLVREMDEQAKMSPALVRQLFAGEADDEADRLLLAHEGEPVGIRLAELGASAPGDRHVVARIVDGAQQVDAALGATLHLRPVLAGRTPVLGFDSFLGPFIQPPVSAFKHRGDEGSSCRHNATMHE